MPPRSPPSSQFREKINRFIGRLQPSMTSGGSRDWEGYEIAIQAFDAMQSTIARQKLAAYPPDTVIEIADRMSDVGVRPGSRDDRIGIQKGQDVRLHDFGWQALVSVTVFKSGPIAISELKRTIAGISQRMLTHTLRGLEARRPGHPDGVPDRFLLA